MNILLDTCTFIWLTSDRDQLSGTAAREVQDDTNTIFFSLASAWELCLKVSTGKIKLPDKPLPWIAGRLNYWKIRPLDIQLEAICQTPELPPVHKDPFDRLLVAQALTQALTILTPDPLIQEYHVQTLW